MAEPIENDVIDGFSCVIFAYGQTGTGKTHTMEGDLSRAKSPKAGVIPRMCESLFKKLLMRKNVKFTLKVTAVELYCERFYDCIGHEFRNLGETLNAPTSRRESLSRSTDDVVEKPIRIQDGAVTNCEEVLVQSPEEIYHVLRHAKTRRRIAATRCNKQSSRSHFIFMLSVRTREPAEDGASEDSIKEGKLYLVDLAGSESLAKSGAEGMRATEAKLINKSNEALKRVIESLVAGWSHVPYRDSRLTQLLRPALGGNAVTHIIGTISPCQSALYESKSTLRYMCMAKQIKNRPKINQSMTQRNLVADLEREQDRLRAQLAAQRAKAGVYMPQEQYDEMDKDRRRLEAKLAAFNEVLAAKDKALDVERKDRDRAASELMTSWEPSKREIVSAMKPVDAEPFRQEVAAWIDADKSTLESALTSAETDALRDEMKAHAAFMSTTTRHVSDDLVSAFERDVKASCETIETTCRQGEDETKTMSKDTEAFASTIQDHVRTHRNELQSRAKCALESAGESLRAHQAITSEIRTTYCDTFVETQSKALESFRETIKSSCETYNETRRAHVQSTLDEQKQDIRVGTDLVTTSAVANTIASVRSTCGDVCTEIETMTTDRDGARQQSDTKIASDLRVLSTMAADASARRAERRRVACGEIHKTYESLQIAHDEHVRAAKKIVNERVKETTSYLVPQSASLSESMTTMGQDGKARWNSFRDLDRKHDERLSASSRERREQMVALRADCDASFASAEKTRREVMASTISAHVASDKKDADAFLERGRSESTRRHDEDAAYVKTADASSDRVRDDVVARLQKRLAISKQHNEALRASVRAAQVRARQDRETMRDAFVQMLEAHVKQSTAMIDAFVSESEARHAKEIDAMFESMTEHASAFANVAEQDCKSLQDEMTRSQDARATFFDTRDADRAKSWTRTESEIRARTARGEAHARACNEILDEHVASRESHMSDRTKRVEALLASQIESDDAFRAERMKENDAFATTSIDNMTSSVTSTVASLGEVCDATTKMLSAISDAVSTSVSASVETMEKRVSDATKRADERRGEETTIDADDVKSFQDKMTNVEKDMKVRREACEASFGERAATAAASCKTNTETIVTHLNRFRDEEWSKWSEDVTKRFEASSRRGMCDTESFCGSVVETVSKACEDRTKTMKEELHVALQSRLKVLDDTLTSDAKKRDEETCANREDSLRACDSISKVATEIVDRSTRHADVMARVSADVSSVSNDVQSNVVPSCAKSIREHLDKVSTRLAASSTCVDAYVTKTVDALSTLRDTATSTTEKRAQTLTSMCDAFESSARTTSEQVNGVMSSMTEMLRKHAVDAHERLASKGKPQESTSETVETPTVSSSPPPLPEPTSSSRKRKSRPKSARSSNASHVDADNEETNLAPSDDKNPREKKRPSLGQSEEEKEEQETMTAQKEAVVTKATPSRRSRTRRASSVHSHRKKSASKRRRRASCVPLPSSFQKTDENTPTLNTPRKRGPSRLRPRGIRRASRVSK